MNKAFIREPDEPSNLKCPRCGAIGAPVGAATVAAHAPAEASAALGGMVCYCTNPSCTVGYFDSMEQVVPSARLRRLSYPKQPTAPLCRCFNVTADQIIADAAAGDPSRVRRLIERSRTAEARCAEASAGGQCCVGEAQRLYLRHLERRP